MTHGAGPPRPAAIVAQAVDRRLATRPSPMHTTVPPAHNSATAPVGLRRGQSETGDQRAAPKAGAPPLLDDALSRRGTAPRSPVERLEARACGLGPHRDARWLRIQDDAAADGDGRRVRAKDEPVAARQDGRFLEPDAGVSRSSRRYGAPGWRDECRSDWDDALVSSFDWCTHGDSTDDFAGPLMEAHARAVPQRPALPSRSIATSKRRVASTEPGEHSVSPRDSSATSTPPRLTATRSPATASVRRRRAPGARAR